MIEWRKAMMFLPTVIVVFLLSSADLLMPKAQAFRLFDELDFTITSVNTTWIKSPTRAPDMYVCVDVAAKNTDGSLKGPEVNYACTIVHKKTQTPIFNQTFNYVRFQDMRYTFGTDNVLMFKLMDQGLGYEDDVMLGQFDLHLNFTDASPPAGEQFATVVNETLSVTSTIGYKVHYLFHSGVKQTIPDLQSDDYEADISDSPLFHVHRIRHGDGSIEIALPDYSFSVDLELADTF